MYLIISTFWMILQKLAAAEIGEMILKLALLSLDLEQRRLSCIISHNTLHYSKFDYILAFFGL